MALLLLRVGAQVTRRTRWMYHFQVSPLSSTALPRSARGQLQSFYAWVGSQPWLLLVAAAICAVLLPGYMLSCVSQVHFSFVKFNVSKLSCADRAASPAQDNSHEHRSCEKSISAWRYAIWNVPIRSYIQPAWDTIPPTRADLLRVARDVGLSMRASA